MTAKPGTGPRVAGGIVRVAALLVPVAHRADWLREWLAELSAVAAVARPVVPLALGALRHGLWLRREGWTMGMERFVRDVRVGTRSLARRPMFALTAGLTLALSIGVTTAVYTVVDRVLLAPLPYPGAERLLRVRATAQSVARRTREIGIRIALGASAEEVLRRVFREGLGVVAAGLAVGLGIAAWGSSLMTDLLYGIEATDPITYAFVTLLLLAVAALAVWIPTRRATRVHPADTLRAE